VQAVVVAKWWWQNGAGKMVLANGAGVKNTVHK